MRSTGTTARAAAIKQLTNLIENSSAFSYLRMGDGELAYLLSIKSQKSPEIARHPGTVSIETAHCCPGLDLVHGPRLLAAYEKCSYLDTHVHLEFNRLNFPSLQLARVAGTTQTEAPAAAGLIMEWGWHELPDYLARHKVLFCGAEAALLQELLKDACYLKIAARIWGAKPEHLFVQPVEDGMNLSRNLEAIRTALVEKISLEKPDTVFLALGGAAKILCVELSQALNIRCIDFGSVLRALTYSGSAGHAGWRASHSPFFFRVPFEIYMGAFERAHPEAPPEVLLLKAHAQLCLELQHKVAASSTPSDVISSESYDPSPENLKYFHESLEEYRRLYQHLRKKSPECRRLGREFDWWMTKKELNRQGRLRSMIRRCKQVLTGK